MQVDPIKPTLKAPGTERLKRKCDEPPSNFAFNFNLRRYSQSHKHVAEVMEHMYRGNNLGEAVDLLMGVVRSDR